MAEGIAWIDRETARNVVRSHDPLDTGKLWGTMKLQANGVRTVILHALMHTQGLLARPWRKDLRLGAVRTPDGGLAIAISAEKPWRGKLVFDIPRYREYMGFTKDWPRMNTLPEWFTVEPEKTYRVTDPTSDKLRTATGEQLHAGLPVEVEPGKPRHLAVST